MLLVVTMAAPDDSQLMAFQIWCSIEVFACLLATLIYMRKSTPTILPPLPSATLPSHPHPHLLR